jgi:ribosomal protein S21
MKICRRVSILVKWKKQVHRSAVTQRKKRALRAVAARKARDVMSPDLSL